MKSKTQFSPISHLVNNGTRINDSVKMANIFNNYFVNVGSQIDKTIPRTKKSPTDYLINRIPESLFLAPVTSAEIEIIINSLNIKKAIDPYSIFLFFYYKFSPDLFLNHCLLLSTNLLRLVFFLIN